MPKLSKKNLSLSLIAVVLLAFIVANYLNEDSGVSDASSEKNEVASGVVKKNTNNKSIVKNQQRPIPNKRISQKAFRNGSFAHSGFDDQNRQKYIQEKAEQQKNRQAIAKSQYERQQFYKAQQQAALKSKKDYYAMQKVLSTRNPNQTSINPAINQNKQVKNYMARNNYLQRQKQMQERMKMQSKSKDMAKIQ